MARRFLLCAEDALSATLARELCDRVVRERARADWLRALWAPELCETQRAWDGLGSAAGWADRTLVDREAEARGITGRIRIRETGRVRAFRGPSGFAFKALQLAETLEPRPDVVVLAGDTDSETDPEALRGAGVAASGSALPVLVAEIRREAEAWLVAGFVPRTGPERERLEAATHELGFDPTLWPERLMSNRTGDPRDAKRIARLLLGASELSLANPRLRACWGDTPLEHLRERGARAGLADYLDQVERTLLPLLGDDPA